MTFRASRLRGPGPALALWVGSLLLAGRAMAGDPAGGAELPPVLAADYDLLLEAGRFEAEALAVSPDGRWVVASVHTRQTHYLRYLVGVWRRVLVRVDLAEGGMEVLTAPEEDAHAPVWVGDGGSLAFVARRDGRPTIEVLEPDGHRRLLVTTSAGSPRPQDFDPWLRPSSDGRHLLYALQHGVPWWQESAGLAALGPADLPEKPIVIGPEARAPLLRAQGMKQEYFTEGPETTVHAVPVAGGEPRELAAGAGLPRSGYAISGSDLLGARWDGRRGGLLVTEGTEVRGIELGAGGDAGGEAVELPGRILLDRSLPGGRTLALVATEDGAWETLALSLPEEGGVAIERRARGPALDDVFPLLLAADGRRLLVRRVLGPRMVLLVHDLASGRTVEVLGVDGVTKRVAAAVPGRDEALVVRSTATTPERLLRVGFDGRVLADLGTWPGVPATPPVGVVETVQWESEGQEIEGLLVRPDDDGRARPYPTLLYLHGGPDVPVSADLDYLASGRSQSAAHLFARAGYAVLIPYFRGTAGYGDRFEGALGNGKLYSGPAADSLAGVEALVERGVADPERLGVYGHSFGGMLTAWIVARDHRFRAAISAVGYMDTLHRDRSSGSGDHAFHALPGLGGPEDDLLDAWKRPERYRELSPLEGAFAVRTPTLLLSTAGEQRQLSSYAAFFNALRLNDVPVSWLHFPGAYHTGSWSPEEQRRYAAHAFEWFGRWMGAGRDAEDGE